MPVLLDRVTSGHLVLGGQCNVSAADFLSSQSLDVVLVNNMPDASLEATERQFAGLLAAAAGDQLVRLKLFSLPSVARAEAARHYLEQNYSVIEDLWNSRPDGLIVTDTEPRAAILSDEPSWPSLSLITDWAQYATISTVWSCLAAHVAVLRMDGIGRHLLPQKRSGVFECTSVSDHAMMHGMPRQFSIPHSRCNDLAEDELTAGGYTILSRSPQAGVDSFVKRTRSTFVFFQGHPEYEAATLFREYRRDVARFLSGERPSYPAIPEGYFAQDATDRLAAFQERALGEGGTALLAEFPAVEHDIVDTWRPGAVQLYRNWLTSIAAEKDQRQRSITGSSSNQPALIKPPYAGANVIPIERDRPSAVTPSRPRSRRAAKRSRSVTTSRARRPKAR
jgi:homoserine O-succinyltransferase